MIAAKFKIATKLLLTALVCVCVTPCSPGQNANQKSPPLDMKMFPDGLTHDFGTVKNGTHYEHTFRIVNTSNAVLRVTGLRTS